MQQTARMKVGKCPAKDVIKAFLTDITRRETVCQQECAPSTAEEARAVQLVCDLYLLTTTNIPWDRYCVTALRTDSEAGERMRSFVDFVGILCAIPHLYEYRLFDEWAKFFRTSKWDQLNAWVLMTDLSVVFQHSRTEDFRSNVQYIVDIAVSMCVNKPHTPYAIAKMTDLKLTTPNYVVYIGTTIRGDVFDFDRECVRRELIVDGRSIPARQCVQPTVYDGVPLALSAHLTPESPDTWRILLSTFVSRGAKISREYIVKSGGVDKFNPPGNQGTLCANICSLLMTPYRTPQDGSAGDVFERTVIFTAKHYNVSSRFALGRLVSRISVHCVRDDYINAGLFRAAAFVLRDLCDGAKQDIPSAASDSDAAFVDLLYRSA